jgi:hypothetical protein
MNTLRSCLHSDDCYRVFSNELTKDLRGYCLFLCRLMILSFDASSSNNILILPYTMGTIMITLIFVALLNYIL